MPEQETQTFGERLFQLRFHKMKLSQKEFSNKYSLPLGSVKDWEQNRVKPTASTVVLFETIKLNPDLVATASDTARNEVMKNRKQGGFPTTCKP